MICLLGAILSFAVPVWAASGEGGSGAVLTGVVRDSQGVAQMGALVQVLTGDSRTIATAFTDMHGRYRIADLVPGLYQVRASATLLVPVTREHLKLLVGSRAVVNLTLATLFDTASWLPAHVRGAGEVEDDWKWTLRSTASRPILRLGGEDETPASVDQAGSGPRIHGHAGFTAGDAFFGSSGVQTVLDATEELRARSISGGGSVVSVRMATATSDAGMSDVDASAGFEHTGSIAGEGGSRTLISFSEHPEIRTGAAVDGVSIVTLRSGQQIALGEAVALEVGGELQAVQAGSVAISAHPFVRLTAHPAGSWRLQYRMATTRNTQGYADLNAADDELPVAVVADGKLKLESGRHQEVAISRSAGRTVLEVAYYHDAIAQIAVSGGGESSAAPDANPTGLMVDPGSGMFRALGGSSTTNGARVDFIAPMSSQVWVAAEYSTGDALSSETGPQAQLSAALAGLHSRYTQAAVIAIKGKVVASGTRVRASYRWQPENIVTSVNPYGGMGDQAYLSFFLRQRLHCGRLLPPGLDATVDVTNLLAQGYRPFLSADGQTLYFAQAPRTMQAGLSFSF